MVGVGVESTVIVNSKRGNVIPHTPSAMPLSLVSCSDKLHS